MPSGHFKLLFGGSKYINVFILFCSIQFRSGQIFLKNNLLAADLYVRQFNSFKILMLQYPRFRTLSTSWLLVSFLKSTSTLIISNQLLPLKLEELFLRDGFLSNLGNNILQISYTLPFDCAILNPYGQSALSGVPRIFTILLSWSTQLAPAKSGQRVYSSAMMQPSAKISTGEL